METLGDLDREDAGASASTTTASSSSGPCWGGAIATNSPRLIYPSFVVVGVAAADECDRVVSPRAPNG